MSRLIGTAVVVWVIAALAILSPPSVVKGQVPMTGAGLGVPSSGFTPSCTPSSTLIAAMDGSENKSAVDTLICGLNSQSSTISGTLLSRLDWMHVYAVNSTTNALLNWVNPGTFNGVAHGSPTFAANAGYTGADASTTIYIDSQFNPSTASSPNFQQNSATIFAWAMTNSQSTASGGSVIGYDNGSTRTNILPWYSDGFSYFPVNDASPTGQSIGSSNGLSVGTRTGASVSTGFRNTTSFGINTSSTTVANGNFFVLARNNGTGPAIGSGLQISIAGAGAGYSSTDESNFCTLLGAYLHTVNGLTSPC